MIDLRLNKFGSQHKAVVLGIRFFPVTQDFGLID